MNANPALLQRIGLLLASQTSESERKARDKNAEDREIEGEIFTAMTIIPRLKILSESVGSHT
jgi:hypothetical protein